MSVIRAENLTKFYGGRVGVQSIGLDVPEGAIFGFLGPNGAGKTTTIRLLLGFLRASDGRADIFGIDCWRDSHRIKRDVGYLPGDLRLYPWLTGRSALGIVGRIRGVDLRATGAALAERFGLEMTVRVRNMSRGMRQKLGLILALAHRPRLLVLDEPTSGLDPLMQEALASELRGLASAGHTVFFSSHRLSEVEQLCDRIAIVRAGRIVADEPLDALRGRARRQVRIVFRDEAAARGAEPPDFLTRRGRRGAEWRCEMDGEAGPLLEWMAGRPVRDLAVGPPDLEQLFRRFYREDDGEGGS